MAAQPDSIDACNLVQQAYWRKGDVPGYQEAITKLCTLHLKQRYHEAAWKDYEDFLNSGGKVMPAAIWLELCRAAEGQQNFDRALEEYDKLAAVYPSERQAIMARMGAGRICLARLNRPQDALRHFETAAASPAPHLDLETDLMAGIRAAKAAISPGATATAAVARA
jgi:tetratricopeptide (TPR) repeat protein